MSLGKLQAVDFLIVYRDVQFGGFVGGGAAIAGLITREYESISNLVELGLKSGAEFFGFDGLSRDDEVFGYRSDDIGGAVFVRL